MKKVLVTDGVHPKLLQGLETLGYECDYQPKIALETVRAIVPNYEGLIINSKILVDKYMLDRAVQLEFVGRLGSGMEIIDRDYAALKGVGVFGAPEGNRNAVAEHALGMLLALLNNFRRADAQVRQGVWDREGNRGYELMGQTVGIIGFGHTGSQFAKKLSGMGVKILAYDKYKTNYASGFQNVRETTMQAIFEQADIISFHLPLTVETHHLVDAQFIQQLHRKTIIINTSRGKVIDTAALLKGLEEGKVRGACLDVFENEKPHTFTTLEKTLYQRLYQFENVVLTPHVAGWTFESKERLATVLLDKISSFLAQRKG